MSRTVTLSSLESQVRQRSDTESLTARFPQSEVWEYINQSWAELYNKLVQSGQEFYLSSYSFTTSNGVSDYALPSDFYLDKGCDTTISGQLYVLDRWQWEEREQYDQLITWMPGLPFAYAIMGSNVSLRPVPGGVYTVRLWYYPAPQRMVLGTDVIDCLAGFEEYIVASAAAKILAKDDRDASEQKEQAARAMALVNSMVANRSRSTNNKVIRRWKRHRYPLRAA